MKDLKQKNTQIHLNITQQTHTTKATLILSSLKNTPFKS